MNARHSYRFLLILSVALVVVSGAAVIVHGVNRWGQLRDTTPRLNARPGPLSTALDFRWRDFPSMPDAERKELGELVPIDPPLRLSDVRPWVTNPSDPALGAGEAAGNAELQEAFRLLGEVGERRRAAAAAAAAGELSAGDEAGDLRLRLNRAKALLSTAQRSSPQSLQWLILYNQGIVYLWQDNSGKAAKELTNAEKELRRRLESSSSAEVLAAGAHAFYALGDALAGTAGKGPRAPAPSVPGEAVDSLREAVKLSVRLVRLAHPQGVAHAAEFFDIPPTGLPTRALRNDLLAAYLMAPSYRLCPEPMTVQACSQPTSPNGRCGYRDHSFCTTSDKVSNRLKDTYGTVFESYLAREAPESQMFAMQTIAELESENALARDVEVSYNVAHLLLTLKRPELAYAFIAPAVADGDPAAVTLPVERLAFVTSISAGERPAAMGEVEAEETPPSAYRRAYAELYKGQQEPPMFRPLQVGDEQKTARLDAWLFIRRYRYLLAGGDFEGFIREHDTLMRSDLPSDFLEEWRQEVVAELLKGIGERRRQAGPREASLIDEFLSRRDLFSRAQLSAAGLDPPFWSLRRRTYLDLALWSGLWLVVALALIWLSSAYRWTFLGAYQRDRERTARLQEAAS